MALPLAVPALQRKRLGRRTMRQALLQAGECSTDRSALAPRCIPNRAASPEPASQTHQAQAVHEAEGEARPVGVQLALGVGRE